MPPSPLQQLQQSLREATTTPHQIAANSLAHSNTNANHNVYLAQNPADLAAQATTLEALAPTKRPPLYSIPISLKDCFDLRGYITTCGSRFYADHTPAATQDSWVAAQLKKSGALITGKTHLHQLAYGITGENPDFGDSLQPIDRTRLTGGSSSGAVASVQEGSALCRHRHRHRRLHPRPRRPRRPRRLPRLHRPRRPQIPTHPEIWHGGIHLAPSFDTLGILFRDLRDGPALATAIFDIPAPTHIIRNPRIAIVPTAFLYDAEPEVLSRLRHPATNPSHRRSHPPPHRHRLLVRRPRHPRPHPGPRSRHHPTQKPRRHRTRKTRTSRTRTSPSSNPP